MKSWLVLDLSRDKLEKTVVLACYIPPGYKKKRGEAALEHVSDVITEIKRRFKDPFIMIGGDFNQWDIWQALLDFGDISEVVVGCTRGSKSIDRLFTNCRRRLVKSGTIAPLESEDSELQSDHRVAYASFEIPRVESFTWQKCTYRHYNQDSVNDFKQWIVFHDWAEVYTARGSNNKTNAYQSTIAATILSVKNHEQEEH